MPQFTPLCIDVVNRQLVRGFGNSIQASLPPVYQGDTLYPALRFLQPTGNTTGGAPYADLDYSAATVKAGIGTPAAGPSSGAFTLTDPDVPAATAGIAWNAPSADAQTAVRTLANWSAATVTSAFGGWIVINGANAARTPLQGGGGQLSPASLILVDEVAPGSGTTPAINFIRLVASPIAFQDAWTPGAAPAVTVTELTAGGAGVNEVQQIVITGSPYDGTFTLTFGGQTTTPLPYNSTPAVVQAALTALSSITAGGVIVGGAAGGPYIVTWTATGAKALLTASSVGLVGPLTLNGSLSLATVGLDEAMGSASSLAETFEVQVTLPGGQPQTVLQAPITILAELLRGAPDVPTPTDYFYTAAASDARFAQLAPPKGSYRIKAEGDGTINLQFYNATTGLWHTFFPTGPAGNIQSVWGVGEA